MDANGNAIAVWRQSDGLRDNIWANRFAPGTGWGSATLIETDNAGDARLPQIAMDPDGNGIAVWRQYDGTRFNIRANRFVPGTGWGIPTLIETDAGNAFSPQIAVDPEGNGIAVWHQSDGTRTNTWANRFVPGVGWGTPTVIETDTGDAESPQIAVDPEGNGIAVWWQDADADPFGGAPFNIWANRYVREPPDTVPPALGETSAVPDPVELGVPIKISTQASDDLGVAQVTVEIRDPEGNSVGNFAMTSTGSGAYEYDFSPTTVGTFTYRIVAADAAGNAATAGGSFVVRDTTSPIANAGPDQTVTQGTVVRFDGSGSSDLGEIASYTWTLNEDGPVSLTGPNPTHRFDAPGTYLVTLTDTDPSGNSATDTVVVTVTAAPSPPTGLAAGFVAFGAVAVVATVALAWVLRRRRRGEKPRAAPPDPREP